LLNWVKSSEAIFFDFDGVIKESHLVKNEIIRDLFSFARPEVLEAIIKDHISNNGVSRFEKIPKYLNWAGVGGDAMKVNLFLDKFKFLAVNGVMSANWVPGAPELIKRIA
jgi:hypothetical protein